MVKPNSTPIILWQHTWHKYARNICTWWNRALVPPPIQAGRCDLFPFSYQVRSLTYDIISKHPHGHKMPQLHNAAKGWQQNSKPPGTHFWISWIFHAGHLSPGQPLDLAHKKPTTEHWNCLLILLYKLYYPNSVTSNIVVIHYSHVSLHYFAFFTFVWRHRGPFGSSAFFVNNFRSHWDRE